MATHYPFNDNTSISTVPIDHVWIMYQGEFQVDKTTYGVTPLVAGKKYPEVLDMVRGHKLEGLHYTYPIDAKNRNDARVQMYLRDAENELEEALPRCIREYCAMGCTNFVVSAPNMEIARKIAAKVAKKLPDAQIALEWAN